MSHGERRNSATAIGCARSDAGSAREAPGKNDDEHDYQQGADVAQDVQRLREVTGQQHDGDYADDNRQVFMFSPVGD